MPQSHNELISRVCKVNHNVIVVLQNGAPVEMPWIEDTKAVLENYLGGQAGSAAAVEILYGNANPSESLPKLFPRRMRIIQAIFISLRVRLLWNIEKAFMWVTDIMIRRKKKFYSLSDMG